MPIRSIPRTGSLAILALTSLAAAAMAATPSSEEILGFESSSSWTSSQGQSELATERTQGQASLSVSRFWYTEVQSQAVTGVGESTDEIGLDLWIPANTTWGTIQLVATAPSANFWEQLLGQANLSASQAGSWNTLRFPVSAAAKAMFAARPSDLRFKLRLSLPWTEVGYRLDNLRFLGQNPTRSRVEIRVPVADDFVYAETNNIRRRIGYWGQSDSFSQWRDVSSWFMGGDNELTIMAANRSGPYDARVEVRVDGGAPIVVDCQTARCLSGIETGVFLRTTIRLAGLNLPAGQNVTFTSADPGKLYLEDQYTGRTTPTTLLLPRGSYRAGVGVSTDVAPYSGRFHEKVVQVGAQTTTIDMETQGAPMPVQHTTRIAVLPIARSIMDDGSPDGLMTTDMVNRFRQQFQNTRNMLFRPLAYGLADLDVTILPMETELPLRVANAASLTDSTWSYMSQAKFQPLFSQYNFVVVVHSNLDANLSVIPTSGGWAGSGGQVIGFPISWSWSRTSAEPSDGLLHEMLHQFEDGSESHHHLTTGIQGLHGAEEHGYAIDQDNDDWNNTQTWLAWYRVFMRGQAGESLELQTLPQITAPLSSAPYHVGTFSSMRHGLRTSAPY
ncbi:MAG: hypothetical protein IPO40_22215 [Fibrobacteres bacterium]|nr:hypothetical protein [Fibrobacterota bacterium]